MDDFFDDFDEGMFMGGDDFEDNIEDNCEQEDSVDDDPKMANEPGEADSLEDSFSASEAYFFGTAIAFGYEEGMEEAERRRLEKKVEDDKGRSQQ